MCTTSDIINGCSLKPPTHGHPCPKWPPKDTTVPVFQWRASCCLSWEAVMVTTVLPLVTMYAPAWRCIPASRPADSTIISILCTSSNHCHPWLLTEAVLAVLPSTVQCMTTEKLSLQWEDEDQATAQVLDYSQPNPAWTESNYYSFIYCFIWLFSL